MVDREHRRDPQSFSSTWVWGKSYHSCPASMGWGPGWGRGSQEKPVGSGGPGPSTEPTRKGGRNTHRSGAGRHRWDLRLGGGGFGPATSRAGGHAG